MSIRSLLGTSIQATEDAVKGVVSLGSSVGDATTWMRRQSARLNSQETIHAEEREYRIALSERNQKSIERAEKLDPEYVSKLKALDELLGIK